MILEINKRYRNSYVKSSIYVLIVKMWRKYRWNWFEQFPGYFLESDASRRRLTFEWSISKMFWRLQIGGPPTFIWEDRPVFSLVMVPQDSFDDLTLPLLRASGKEDLSENAFQFSPFWTSFFVSRPVTSSLYSLRWPPTLDWLIYVRLIDGTT